ncbi:MAG: CDP-glycerol glycerophosphotransferase family protein [Clostridia bacterium]|nr:CDP-glycerol glycerophosphotransferase family protein [Clostridia bacterium]
MFNRYLNKIKKAVNGSKFDYIAYCDLPIEEKTVLLEGGQGSNINGNAFAMLKELCNNPRWSDYSPVFVVTDKTLEKAKNRLSFYGFKNVTLVVRDSKNYCRYLATARYLITDNTFPPYFNKREGQIYLNTWHGTPLKTLGKANKSSLASLANVQKNYLMSDYALFPNEFTRRVFMEDYDLAPLFNNVSFIGNYPRNYIFYDSAAGDRLKAKMGCEDKTVFAYMPTWRDADTKAQKQKQIDKTYEILKAFDEKLSDDTVLLVNLHFLLASEINCDEFKHISYFSSDYDTYEILNACDGLVTDYSSVFFDFAVSGKKIILFAYDKADYLSTRGIYINFESLPFPIVEDVDSVIELMGSDISVPSEFISEYCSNGSVNSCEKIFSLMVTGESDAFELKKHTQSEKLCILYAGNLVPSSYRALKAYTDDNPEYNYIITYRRAISPVNKAKFDSLVGDANIYGLLTAYQYTLKEILRYGIACLTGRFKNKELKTFFKRERKRHFPYIKPCKVVDFSRNSGFMAGILSAFECEKEYVKHSVFCGGKKSKKAITLEKKFGFDCADNKTAEENAVFNLENAAEKIEVLSSYSAMKNKLPLYFNWGNKMRIISLFDFKSPVKTDLNDLYVTISGNEYKPRFYAKKKESRHHKGIYSLTVPVEDMINNAAKENVCMCYDFQGERVSCVMKYFSLIGNLFIGLRGPMNVHKETNTVALFRQTQNNQMIVYTRSRNVTDKIFERFKQTAAFVLSFLWHTKKAKKLVLLFEKNSSKYEESASVLYEKLIDEGYNNAYFIVDKNYTFLDSIPENYRKNIIYKYTFKHYLYFFKANTFIGTEAIAHSFDLKTCNLLPLFKISRKNLNYVFLQHGVMYMVSLDSESREMFKRKELTGKYRVIVSSKAESDHFTTLGRHLEEDIYISGLPKFDRNILNDDADKIVIMPTWRPWEINTARSDFSETPYFKMLMKLYKNVPDELKDKVIILPHPLIVNELSKASPDVTDKIVTNVRYDDVLKTAKLLITDYSSIAYDSFYRGSNVIFYWEEKDYCMAQYGPSTKLMLNEENVYGDFFYNEEGLSDAILRNYNNPQTDEYKRRYSKLVDYHDGKNTERLIGFLKKDGII